MPRHVLVALAAFALTVLSMVTTTPALGGGISSGTSLAGRWIVTIHCQTTCFSNPRDKVSTVVSTVILRPVDSQHPNIYQDTYLNSYLLRDMSAAGTAITYRLDYEPVIVYASLNGPEMYGKFCSCRLNHFGKTMTGAGIKVVEGDRKVGFTTPFSMTWTYVGPFLAERYQPLAGTDNAPPGRPLHDGGRPVCG